MGKFKNYLEEYMNEAIGDFSQAGELAGDIVSGIKSGAEAIGTTLKNMIHKLSTLREAHKKLVTKIEELRSKKSKIENQIEKQNYSKQIKLLESQAAKMQQNIDRLAVEKEKEVQREFEKRKRARDVAKKYREKKKTEKGIKPKEKKEVGKPIKEKEVKGKSAVKPEVKKEEKPMTEKQAGAARTTQLRQNRDLLENEMKSWQEKKKSMTEKAKTTGKPEYKEMVKKIDLRMWDIEKRIDVIDTKLGLIKMHMKAASKG